MFLKSTDFNFFAKMEIMFFVAQVIIALALEATLSEFQRIN